LIKFYRVFNGALGIPRNAMVEEIEIDLDDEEDEFDFSVAEPSPRQDVLVEYDDIPAIRITAGSIFATVMGSFAAFLALPLIIDGLFVSSVESAFGTGTGFGAIIVLMGIGLLIFFATGITFGVKMAKGDSSCEKYQ
jgi:hypothetical protein